MPCRFFFCKKMLEDHTTKDLLQEICIKPDLESKRNYLTNTAETRQGSKEKGWIEIPPAN
jgi:hypothetical protein